MWDVLGSWFLVVWGAVVSVYAAPALWHSWRARRWPVTTGRVLAARVRYHRARSGGFLPEVTYEYVVGGATFTGERLRFGGWTLLAERGARASLGGAEAGAVVPVYYDPRRPGRSVLRPGVLVFDLVWLAAGLVALAAGLHGLGLRAHVA